MLIDIHVREGKAHIPVLIGDKEVGGSGSSRNAKRLAQVNSQLAAGGGNFLGIQIIAQNGYHPGVNPQEGHVVGDVSPHTAQAHVNLAGVGVFRDQLFVGDASNIHVYAADYHGIGGSRKNISFSGYKPFFHQVGDVDTCR